MRVFSLYYLVACKTLYYTMHICLELFIVVYQANLAEDECMVILQCSSNSLFVYVAYSSV